MLESVSNLTVTPLNSTTVLISWSPPFTLERVDILGYNVTITNTISGESEIFFVKDTTTLLYPTDPENSFIVTVVPINEVGAGNNTLLLFGIITSEFINSVELFFFLHGVYFHKLTCLRNLNLQVTVASIKNLLYRKFFSTTENLLNCQGRSQEKMSSEQTCGVLCAPPKIC